MLGCKHKMRRAAHPASTQEGPLDRIHHEYREEVTGMLCEIALLAISRGLNAYTCP
jgi:hypothetical protein